MLKGQSRRLVHNKIGSCRIIPVLLASHFISFQPFSRSGFRKTRWSFLFSLHSESCPIPSPAGQKEVNQIIYPDWFPPVFSTTTTKDSFPFSVSINKNDRVVQQRLLVSYMAGTWQHFGLPDSDKQQQQVERKLKLCVSRYRTGSSCAGRRSSCWTCWWPCGRPAAITSRNG